MPLVYWDPTRRGEITGDLRIRFRLGTNGYVEAAELVRSSQDSVIDNASTAVLHIAEPYIYVPGWIEIDLTFRG